MRVIYVTALLAMNGSLMLALPEAVQESLNLTPETLVALSVAEERLVVEPRRRPRYRLSDLMQQCDAAGRLSDEDHAWFDAAPACPEEA